MNVKLSDYHYHLPPSLIAQRPLDRRDSSRLLVLNRDQGSISHERFDNIDQYLLPGDALVLNDTKVMPSRLIGRRADTGGKVELLLLSPEEDGKWEALIKPHKKGLLKKELIFGDGDLTGRMNVLEEDGRARISFSADGPLKEKLLIYCKTPLPPYIKRESETGWGKIEMMDRECYQTVYAKHEGALAAPTAGLHFTTGLLEKLSSKGVHIVTITLHVGIGTFKPIRHEDIRSHRMDAERYNITDKSAETINRTRETGHKVVCVGSTTTRTLETCADTHGKIEASRAASDLFIYPGYRFKTVDGLVTNFHLPASTPLMMVSAFAECELVLSAYREAVRKQYRFYSYGDAMLII